MLAFHWEFLFLFIGLAKTEHIMQQAINAFAEFHAVKCHILLFTYNSNEFHEQRVLLDFYRGVMKNKYKPTVLESINNENRESSSLSTRKGCSKPLRSFIMGSVSHIAKYMIAEKRREDIRKDVWLLFVANDFEQELILSQIKLSIGSEVYLARRKNNGFEFWEIYQPATNNPIRKIYYGDWNADTGLRATPLTIFERRRDFGGAVFRSAKFQLERYNYIQDERHVQLLSNIAAYLEKELNFTTEAVIVNLNNSDYQPPENPQNVIVRMLARNEADLSMVGVMPESASLSIIDYSGPIDQIHHRVYIKKQAVGFESGWHFSNPFPSVAWYIMVPTAMIAPVVILLMYYIGCKVGLIRNQPSFSDLCVTIHQMWCLQGGDFHRELYSISLAFVVLNLWAFFIRTIYSASLASSLAIEEYLPPFNSLEEMLKDSQYEFGVQKLSLARELYNRTQYLYVKNLNKAVIERNIANLPETYLEGLQRICSEKKYAFMANRRHASKLNSKIPCKLHYLPNEAYTVSTAYAMTKHNEYLPFINHWLHFYNQVGLMEKMKDNTFGRESLTLDDSQSFRSLTLQDMLFLQIILIVGIVLSVLILFAEIVHRGVKRNRRTIYR